MQKGSMYAVFFLSFPFGNGYIETGIVYNANVDLNCLFTDMHTTFNYK